MAAELSQRAVLNGQYWVFKSNIITEIQHSKPLGFLLQARDWISITSPFMSSEKTYLAIVSSDQDPSIYAWDRYYTKKFAKVQDIPSERTRDMVFFNMGETVYLAVASHRSTDIYQGS